MANQQYTTASRYLMPLLHFILSAALVLAFTLVLLDWGAGYTDTSPTGSSVTSTYQTTTPSPAGVAFNPNPTTGPSAE